MDKILQIFYELYKKIRPRTRLYKYGKLGLTFCDDRTLKEKILDKIDDFFFRWQQNIRYRKAKRKAIWNSYFDFGLGKYVNSSAEIRAKEKQGYVYISDQEAERYAKERRILNKKESREKTAKFFEEGIAKIRAGNSNYYHELQERFRNRN